MGLTSNLGAFCGNLTDNFSFPKFTVYCEPLILKCCSILSTLLIPLCCTFNFVDAFCSSAAACINQLARCWQHHPPLVVTCDIEFSLLPEMLLRFPLHFIFLVVSPLVFLSLCFLVFFLFFKFGAVAGRAVNYRHGIGNSRLLSACMTAISRLCFYWDSSLDSADWLFSESMTGFAMT